MKMKTIKLTIIILVAFFASTSLVSAQNQVAHIDTQKLISEMPEMKLAQNELKKLQQTFENEIQTMSSEFKKKMEQYQAEVASKSDDENAKRAQEVEGMRNNIMKYEENAQKELGQKQENLIKPIMEKERLAIQKIAKAKGYQYVIDATPGSGLIFAEGPDLAGDVKKELGM